ncbi:u3 small nucleolar RNA-associated protein 11 [Stereum hirsutum FP-91666 SS1]|uniref:u3 small nucleolar RNA-associated protein 11 n=1 Tax=Stereum hirsutum (strain FP-91666) TaxID=721885 RepID=UPI000440B244|nr:u3 small nucleolar RNA-associated protein 11 [Stereum hirsutum FP-91666 SS1]EIM92248.1 u3 small nucleolar RNA-associated protein 11 [Stereum hirsutum FP-91666 SS1]
MSSLRNSLHRRNHKERSQLAHRERFGILEKHKDYVLRARDYHSKQDRLTRLRQKASERNKDEFYFGMNGKRTEGGVHVQDRGNAALPADMVKVLKSQDENYIRMVRTAGLKKIEKLKSQLSTLADLFTSPNGDDENVLDEDELEVLRDAGILAGPSGSGSRKTRKNNTKHIVFVENEEEAQQYRAASKPISDETPMDISEDSLLDLGWKAPTQAKVATKSKKTTGGRNGSAATVDNEGKKEATIHRQRLLKELSARLSRDRMLRYAERELEMQKLLMGRGGSQKIQGVTKEDDDDDDEEEEEDEDARPSQARGGLPSDAKAYKPRVYKWRAERKR